MTQNLEVLQLPEDQTSREQLPGTPQAAGPKPLFGKGHLGYIAKAIATALDDREKQKEAKADVKTDF